MTINATGFVNGGALALIWFAVHAHGTILDACGAVAVVFLLMPHLPRSM